MKCFIYLALPPWLADQFPPRKHPPHVTLVFLGDVAEGVYEASVEIFERVLQEFDPFPVALAGYREFTTSKGRYPHMAVAGPQLKKLQSTLVAALRANGIRPKQSGFVPHATLARIPKGASYEGPKPLGTWLANSFVAVGYTDYEIELEFSDGPRQVIIMRGIPGSGKSTYLAENYPSAFVASADHYFIKNGMYQWDSTKAYAAHVACQQYFRALIEGRAPLIAVDNTNISTRDIKPYYKLAKDAGYEIQIVTLLEDPDVAFEAGIHGVTQEQTHTMHDKLLRVQLPNQWDNLIIDYR